jgi:hypothetical protein
MTWDRTISFVLYRRTNPIVMIILDNHSIETIQEV